MDALPFQPCVDGALLPRLPREEVRAGGAAPVPILVGTNLEEWRFYALADPEPDALDEAGLRRRLLAGGWRDDAEGAARVIEAYREARRACGEASTPHALWCAIETDRWFREPAEELAMHHAGDAWSYLFTWRTAALGGRAGACHSLEVPFVFGLGSDLGRLVAGDDPEAPSLSRRIQDAWLAFARNGDPRTDALPAWRPFASADGATQCLGAETALLDAHREAERAVRERPAP
jgi:para-nitrobenzyl esterase